jgi:putative photosynthetic complex assembly protein
MADLTQTQPQSEKIPRALVRAMLALVLGVLALVTIARVTGMEPAAQPPIANVAYERLIVIGDNPAGGVLVTDAVTGAVIADLVENSGGFVGGVRRALEYDRSLHQGIPADAPVRLVRWDDGRLSLIDPESDWAMELWGFGETNYRAFAALIDDATASN